MKKILTILPLITLLLGGCKNADAVEVFEEITLEEAREIFKEHREYILELNSKGTLNTRDAYYYDDCTIKYDGTRKILVPYSKDRYVNEETISNVSKLDKEKGIFHYKNEKENDSIYIELKDLDGSVLDMYDGYTEYEGIQGRFLYSIYDEVNEKYFIGRPQDMFGCTIFTEAYLMRIKVISNPKWFNILVSYDLSFENTTHTIYKSNKDRIKIEICHPIDEVQYENAVAIFNKDCYCEDLTVNTCEKNENLYHECGSFDAYLIYEKRYQYIKENIELNLPDYSNYRRVERY